MTLNNPIYLLKNLVKIVTQKTKACRNVYSQQTVKLLFCKNIGKKN